MKKNCDSQKKEHKGLNNKKKTTIFLLDFCGLFFTF